MSWDRFAKAVEANVRVIYLWGVPGLGKTFTAKKILRELTGKTVFDITCFEDAVGQELVGHYIPRGNIFEWHDGPVVRAMKEGALVINELPRASFAVRDMFLSVLDSEASASITLPTGEQITPHKKFRVIVTGNSSPADSQLTDAMLDRMESVIEVTEPHPDLLGYLASIDQTLAKMLENAYSMKNKERNRISTRRMLTVANMIKNGCQMQKAIQIVFNEAEADSIAAAYNAVKLAKAK